MKKQTDKIDNKKKLTEKAIERCENEGGEVLEIAGLSNTKAIEERQIAENENLHTDEVSSDVSLNKSYEKKRQRHDEQIIRREGETLIFMRALCGFFLLTPSRKVFI